MRRITLIAAATTFLASLASAQLQIDAFNRELRAGGGYLGMNNWPTGPITTNFAQAGSGRVGRDLISSIARYTLLEQNPDSLRTVELTLDSIAQGLSGTGYPNLSQVARVDVTLSSVTPLPVSVTITAGGGGFTQVVAGSFGSLSSGNLNFSTVLDATGVQIDVDMTQFTFGPGPQNASKYVRIEVVPDVLGTSYGTSCNGPTLGFTSNLSVPPTVTADTQGASQAILLIGTQQLDTPLDQLVGMPWPCPLRVGNILASIPIPTTTGTFDFEFLPPTGTFTLQMLTATTVVNTSNGLEFVRP